ncbi:hypothetical protein P4S95_07725 [Aneurinibacillus aneurinilyticus]|uniref:hypothetical protein n=1 Tax=Aneurinibacillus aneurinilyticus TaxID=1391 RepID=UPI0023F1F6F1|nr:hypothetical protein [Aneurinibacillus aneurinilyticus]MED0670110.1 hypothetical protein [Aneurinibacillus aneurinilyticus]
MRKSVISTIVAGALLCSSALPAFAETLEDPVQTQGTIDVANDNEANLIPAEFFNPDHPNAIKDPAIIEKFNKMLEEKSVDNSKIQMFADPVNESAKKSGEVTTYAAPAIVAVYAIPGIGEVALLATGAVLIGGAIYEAGSWLYDVVASWLKSDTARDIIAKKKKGSILREFPSEYLDKTLNEIEKDAKKGVPNAKKAKKLLTDKRFDK